MIQLGSPSAFILGTIWGGLVVLKPERMVPLDPSKGEGVDLLSALAIVWRRKIVFLLVLSLAVILGGVVIVNLKPEYEASANVVILAPNTNRDATGDEVPSNPFSELSDTSRFTAEIVRGRLSTDDNRDNYKSNDLEPNYEVAEPSGPTISLIVKSDSRSRARATVEQLVRDVGGNLATVQAELNVAKSELYTAKQVAPVQIEKRNAILGRTLAALVVLGLTASLGAAFLAEAIATSRKRRSGSLVDVTETESPLVQV